MSSSAEVIPVIAKAVEVLAPESMLARAEVSIARAMEYLELSNQMTVTDKTYQDASEFLKVIKQFGKEIEIERKDITNPLNDAAQWVMNRWRPATDAAEKAERIVKGKMIAHAKEVDRIREEAARAAIEAQEKEAERLRKLAEKAEARGDDVKAAEHAMRAEVVAASPVIVRGAPPAAVAQGASLRTTWSADVTDLKVLAAAVVAGTVPIGAIQADLRFLNATAKATKGMIKWPGVKWISTKGLSQRV